LTVGDPDAVASVITSLVTPLLPVITRLPELAVNVTVPVVTVPLRTLGLVLAVGNTANAPLELGIEPLLQAVPVVQGTVPDVGSHVDWACAEPAA
jgi:hypothetical protein